MESKILIAPEGELCVLVISGGGRVRFVISLVELQVSLSRGVTFTRFCFPFPPQSFPPLSFECRARPFNPSFPAMASVGHGQQRKEGVGRGWMESMMVGGDELVKDSSTITYLKNKK